MKTWRKNVIHSPCYAAFTLNKYSVTFSKHPSVQYLCLFRVTTTMSLLIFKLHKKTNGLIGKIHHIFKAVQQLDSPTLAVRVLGQSDENAPWKFDFFLFFFLLLFWVCVVSFRKWPEFFFFCSDTTKYSTGTSVHASSDYADQSRLIECEPYNEDLFVLISLAEKK